MYKCVDQKVKNKIAELTIQLNVNVGFNVQMVIDLIDL